MVESSRRTREDRAERRRARLERAAPAVPRPVRGVRPLELLSADEVASLHAAALTLLRESGVELMGPAARDAFRAAGALVDDATGLTRIPPELVEATLATAPARFTITPRNPARRLDVGGDEVAFGLVAGPPAVHDRVRGRRQGNLDDYGTLLRLAQSFDAIHFVGNQPTPPVELPAGTRHLDCYRANVVLTDRTYHCSAIGRERARDGVEVMAIARGLTLEEVDGDPCVLSIISVNSPRRLDEAMSDGLMELASRGQVVVVTPFTLMGAMTPVTLTAALVQQHAEALAGVALTQLTRPGSPVVYGAFMSNVDMRSGAPAFGTPENVRATIVAGQLARHAGLPYRASNASTSNAVDAQAAYESQMSLWASMLGGAHLVYHGAGWMEGGLTASLEKVVLDVELLQATAAALAPARVTADDLAESLAAIAEVAPGGHFFGTEHTLARYETAFYSPLLSDWRGYEAWEAAGSPTAEERATAVWQETLERYVEPALDPEIRERLDRFVERRRIELAGVDH